MKILKSYGLITLGVFIYTLGWAAFIIPSKISGGGVSGAATLVYQSTGVPVWITYMLVNIVLLLFGIRALGKQYGVKIVYGASVTTFFFSLLQANISEPVVHEAFMAAVIGGVMSGIGVGLILMEGGSLGGTDIIASIIVKYKNYSPGKILLILDMSVILASYFVFHSVEAIVYAGVVMGVMSYVIDLMLTGRNASVQIFIFSEKHETIAKRICDETMRGVTILDGKGWYSKEEKKIIMLMVRKKEYTQILRIAKNEDSEAFISVASVMGVYGRGFDAIKL
ncbi:membrane protein [Aureibacter tunicatorum]|nr:membrane protein [Aureibacter tunicatorum]